METVVAVDVVEVEGTVFKLVPDLFVLLAPVILFPSSRRGGENILLFWNFCGVVDVVVLVDELSNTSSACIFSSGNFRFNVKLRFIFSEVEVGSSFLAPTDDES